MRQVRKRQLSIWFRTHHSGGGSLSQYLYMLFRCCNSIGCRVTMCIVFFSFYSELVILMNLPLQWDSPWWSGNFCSVPFNIYKFESKLKYVAINFKILWSSWNTNWRKAAGVINNRIRLICSHFCFGFVYWTAHKIMTKKKLFFGMYLRVLMVIYPH